MNALLLATSLVFGLTLPEGLDGDDHVGFEGDVTFVGAVVPEELTFGDTASITLWFTAASPLPPDVWNFLHVESRESACRLVLDRAPGAPEGGLIRHAVELAIPAEGPCASPQRLEVYTGLYRRGGGGRLAVLDPAARADRVHAASITLVADAPNRDVVSVAPSAMARDAVFSALRPWRGWIFGLLAAALLAFLLRWFLARRRRDLPAPTPDLAWLPAAPRRRRLAFLGLSAIVVVPLLLSVFAAFDFIKDDAYISFRYAQNVVAGEGLVFNAGERLEGITNFLWTLLMVPFEALGLDLFQVSEVLGIALCLGLLFYMARIAAHLGGAGKDLAWLWGAAFIATSSSMGLWSTSGMEQALAMFLPVAAAWLLWRTWNDPDPAPKRKNDGLKSGVLMGLGCMTRPEVHLIGFFVGLPMVIRVIKARRLDRTTALWFAGLLAVTVPFHLFRLAYYGSLVPNTFYVKTSDSAMVLDTGLVKLRELLDFNATGVIAMLIPFAFMTRRFLTEKLVMFAVAAAFFAYIVKVGADEMHWHRLYLPALPFLVMLAALGLRDLAEVVARHLGGPRARLAVFTAAWLAVIVVGVSNFAFTYREMSGFNGRGDLSGNFHPDMGKFLTRHDRPGALVAFQDMGSTPYHAPDIAFLDFIGLVDGTVARARYDYGLHAFIATESQKNKAKYDADMRAYYDRRNPEWAILTTYIPETAMGRVSEAFARDPGPAALTPYIAQNGYQFGIYNADFKRRYVHVRTWPRSAGYYLSLFRRADLWAQTPGEVVLDAPPADLTGPTARLGSGLELLGAHVEPTATRKHELFVTTWWRLPGPLAPDLYFFHHVERDGFRLPYDALPGDWMYPADRWQAGQILENRVLVQLPPEMRAGDYQVFVGAYLRGTGERLPILDGPNDGANRLPLGPVEITELVPPFDHLIKPTRPDEQRRHPERIIEHGRVPGT